MTVTEPLFYSQEEVEEIKTSYFTLGWNEALDHVRDTNGEGSRDYL